MSAMKAGAENRKKTIMAGGLGAGALIAVVYIYSQLFGGSTPAPTPSPTVATSAPATRNATVRSEGSETATPTGANGSTGSGNLGVAPGVAAEKLASTSAGLDPTLHETAMLRTESLVYTGSGRNIFSATFEPVAAVLPTNVPPPRPRPATNFVPPPVQTGPPPPPPINLKFFGTAQHRTGKLQGFFLNGDDVYLAAEGDIVARKYKILSIAAANARVEDLSNTNIQVIPLQRQ